MNARIKKIWITALRSGTREQGRGRLRSGNQFCCLGVLCDLHAEETGQKWDKDGEYITVKGCLPPEVAEWAKISSTGRYGPRGNYRFLTADNDYGVSFSKIADIIDKHF